MTRTEIFRSSNLDYFRKYVFFSSRSTFFLIFPGGFMYVHRTDTNFPGRYVCLPNISFFPGVSFLAIEQVPIFQEHHFRYRTETNFPGSIFRILMIMQIGNFQEEFPNRYFSNRSRFSNIEISRRAMNFFGKLISQIG